MCACFRLRAPRHCPTIGIRSIWKGIGYRYRKVRKEGLEGNLFAKEGADALTPLPVSLAARNIARLPARANDRRTTVCAFKNVPAYREAGTTPELVAGVRTTSCLAQDQRPTAMGASIWRIHDLRVLGDTAGSLDTTYQFSELISFDQVKRFAASEGPRLLCEGT